MLTFLGRRLAMLVVTMVVASAIVFTVLEVLPGDPALLILGINAQEDTLAALRAEMGFDRPALVRYFTWVGGFFTGHLGVSHTYSVPVADLIGARLAITVPLAVLAFLMSTLIAVPLGLFAASHHNRPGDYGVMVFSQIGIAVPEFWFGILMVLLFAVTLGWLPAGGFPGWDAGLFPALGALLLPATALAVSQAAILARVTRSAVLEVLRADFVRTARAKGVGEGAILFGHVLRNAAIPMVTILGLQIAFLLAGVIVVENVFTLPGLGRLVYQAVIQRDVIVVRDVVVMLVGMVVFVNFLIDVAYTLIDPRPKVAA